MMQKYILLIDNDEEEHLIFTSVLESMKTEYRVENVFDIKEAISKLSVSLPAFIFLDINMPVDGFECLKKIKTLPQCDGIPVYFYSSKADGKYLEKAKQSGAAGIIEKKPDIAELSHALSFVFTRNDITAFVKL